MVSLISTSGLDSVKVKGVITPTSTIDYLRFFGNSTDAEIALNSQSCDHADFEYIRVSGTGSFGTGAIFVNADLNAVVGLVGLVQQSRLLNTVSLGAGDVSFLFCSSGVAGLSRPTVTITDASTQLDFRSYSGGVNIAGAVSGNNVSMDVTSGTVEFTSSCTGGAAVTRGDVVVVDNSVGMTLTDQSTYTQVSTTIPAQITGLNDFDPTSDAVIVGTIQNNVITSSTIATNAFNNSAFTTGFYNSINAEVDTALADYDAPTKAEMDAAFTEIKGPTFTSTDTLESIRDRGDSAWTTATGFSTFNPAVDVVANVTLVDTVTTNTDMRGTDGANTVAPATPTNVTDAQTAIIAQVDANETKIDLLETKTQADARQALLIAEHDATQAAITTVEGKVDTTVTQSTLARKHLTNRDKIDTTANTLTRYDDNGTTALVTFDLKDADGAASSTQIYEKVPQ